MDKHQLLTDEELAMLRTWETMKTLPPANTCAAPCPSSPKPVAASQAPDTRSPHRRLPIAFPAPLHPGRGGPRRAAHRRADHYRAGFAPSARLATRRKRPCFAPKTREYEVYSLSLGGLIVASLPDAFAKGDPLSGYLRIEDLPPLAMTGTPSGTWMPIHIAMTGPSSSGWARRIRNNCGTGSSSATRTPSSRPIRVTKDNRGARLPCLFPRRSIRDRQLPGSRTPHRHPAS